MQAISKAATRTMSVLHPCVFNYYIGVRLCSVAELESDYQRCTLVRRALKLVSFAIIIKEKRVTGTHMLSGYDADSRRDECLL